ncbi:hypothetical protein [Paucibacter sp. Y2R2-4]|uniref:hypothetical protein n=1 Tax=Paucibacter sp. Y2R2-4 TaxID=2893553 RepID=UPI0021E39CE0|nr:hypothetical protein [Paucibacter sp. Y2R2-4]MCV2350045.1 hypothetical protein [Paucibacter sp. Y2R2-4]
MLARMFAFVVWGLLGLSGGYWLIQLLAKPLATPPQALPAVERQGLQADLTRLFGAAAPAAVEAEAPPAESRFKLLGVVAPKTNRSPHAGEGVALISVDGVARTVRVGALVDGNLRLLKVDGRSATLGDAGIASFTLQMTALAPAATGALQAAQPSAVVLGGALPLPPPLPPAGQDAPYGNTPAAVPLSDPSGPPAR